MNLWALSDLHLSFSGAKPMDVFGDAWRGHVARVEAAWRARVGERDVVCLPGDLSWALRLPDAAEELAWLGSLPGSKVLVKGNHDYWWGSLSAVRRALPPGVHALQNDSLVLDGIAFAGARGWVDRSLAFGALYPEGAGESLESGNDPAEDERLYARDLGRLEASLRAIPAGARLRVALLHYPPTSPSLEETPVTGLLERYGVDLAVFGHLHGPFAPGARNPYGCRNGVEYHLVSADFVGFAPVLLRRAGEEERSEP